MAAADTIWTVDKPWLQTQCALGEGPFFEKQTNSLRFVDVLRKQILNVCLSDGSPVQPPIVLDVVATVTSDIEGIDPREKILVGLKYGIAVLDRRIGSYSIITRFHKPSIERLRSNDGAADPLGRFWLGSMTDFGYGDFLYEGSLWCLGPAESKEEIETGINIPNSIGWSPDNTTLYWVHSKERQINARNFHVGTGATSNQRLFYQHDGTGEPDGFRVDIHGNLWVAVYGESRVLRINASGTVTGQILLPTRFITCVEFVGTELLTTSAQDRDGGEDSKRYGGDVFRIDVGVEGLEHFKFRL